MCKVWVTVRSENNKHTHELYKDIQRFVQAYSRLYVLCPWSSSSHDGTPAQQPETAQIRDAILMGSTEICLSISTDHQKLAYDSAKLLSGERI
jgi:hypothetical protein